MYVCLCIPLASLCLSNLSFVLCSLDLTDGILCVTGENFIHFVDLKIKFAVESLGKYYGSFSSRGSL